MIGELGTFALILALLVSLVQGTLGIWGGINNSLPLMRVARPAAVLQLLLTATAFGLLTTAFLQDDFSIRYVARQSNSLLPTFYKVAAVWGGHEGSLLLWVLMLSGWGAAVALLGRNLPLSVQSLVGGVLGWIGSGLYLFILLTSSPFIRQLPAASDGADLNPLLQDLGLIFHPPLLYMGYVGFSVAFAFAVAALLSGRLDATWARWSRPWTTAAWAMLTLGIMLGSAWAYYELGWGGWWFWDPVENASFMPWLAGTALIHSLAVAEKRNAFKHWTVLLAISTFSLSLLGTFLVRSGVLTSVHAFATDPARGTFILIFLCVVIGTSLALYAWRAPMLEGGGAFDWCSRESLLLANNVLLVVACTTVFIGTLYPLVIDALGQGKLSVGSPYFNSVFIPLMLPAVILMGFSGTIRWKYQDGHGIWLASKVPLILAIVGGALLPLCWGTWRWGVALALAAALWVALMAVRDWSLRLLSYRRAGLSWFAAFCKIPAAFSGMHIAHLGVAVFVAGVTVVSSYEHEDDLRMAIGDTHSIAGYTLRFDGVKPERASNYAALVGNLTLSKNGKALSVLKPEKRQYFSSQMPMTEAAIHHTQIKDIYVALGEPIGQNPFTGDWLVRVHYKPLVGWIWYGCLLMALGGLIALSDQRYRQKRFGKKTR
ncbi:MULTISPECIES: heme lyase CcmF/NrfE family subunit [Deefgea]|uniref:Heme lyase CcmF/NrfE family subunit n=1 Tax=Deefgea chitinilytica TaxID=570276 RepID=A0ABS2CC14_9NEIS|nr:MULTISPECIES: heme lyase CcmF/NrfE family subunit [Deefgea]MBM5571694.1 heme lyase CcmF/NrfE family subunit [Deefgea chitinilytica]MBM9888929.1 heme lyase CcmF/NrfE family subunit [Deefgea sp. CFH1-16]